MTRPLVSLILPAFNEAENLPELRRRLHAVTASLEAYEFEFILVDNCSSDATGELGERFTREDGRWRYLRFSSNFGAEISLAAGLRHARGGAAIFLATDLQDPPEMIPEMLRRWEEGYQVVYGQLRKREDANFLKSLGVKAAYWLIHKLSDIRIPQNATDFRLLARPVIDAVNECREQNRYLRGIVHWAGFRQTGFAYDRAERKAGHSTAGLLFCIGYALNAVLAFSSQPLRLATYVGLFTMLVSILGALVYSGIYAAVWTGHLAYGPPPGWTTLILAVLFLMGTQSFCLGLVGEYIGNIYKEAKARPLWIVDRALGFDAQPEGGLRNLAAAITETEPKALHDLTRHSH